MTLINEARLNSSIIEPFCTFVYFMMNAHTNTFVGGLCCSHVAPPVCDAEINRLQVLDLKDYSDSDNQYRLTGHFVWSALPVPGLTQFFPQNCLNAS